MNCFIPSSWILIIQNSFRHSYPRALGTMYIRSKKDKCNSKKTYHRYFLGPQFFFVDILEMGQQYEGGPTFDPVPNF